MLTVKTLVSTQIGKKEYKTILVVETEMFKNNLYYLLKENDKTSVDFPVC